ncbi:MAG TPA: hypothetical protein VEZ11_14555 [Thermoanaerobaculia bacterium]|nr:hypothetical protein [Thermoanaerobaculia bacterium]
MTTATSIILDTARRAELHHAVILHGPSPAPLRALAARIAKALNCVNGSTGDDCLSCQRIDRRVHPDVHWIEVAGERKMISIEQIRELISGAMLRPYEGRTKVFIVDPADALSLGGSNALLKTLEEPTRDTTFLLITRSPDLLLPTIRSRSQQLYVGPEPHRLAGPRQLSRARGVTVLDSEEELSSLAATMLDLLARYAERSEPAALLALAARIGGHENPKDAIALLGSILCDAVGLATEESLDPDKLAVIRDRISRERLLAAGDAALTAIRFLGVNADARLLAEQIVAALVVTA